MRAKYLIPIFVALALSPTGWGQGSGKIPIPPVPPPTPGASPRKPVVTETVIRPAAATSEKKVNRSEDKSGQPSAASVPPPPPTSEPPTAPTTPPPAPPASTNPAVPASPPAIPAAPSANTPPGNIPPVPATTIRGSQTGEPPVTPPSTEPAAGAREKPAAKAVPSSWSVQVEILSNATRMIARSKNAELKVQSRQLSVQSPSGVVQAEGEVQVEVTGIQIHCDRLVINWDDDWVQVEGAVRLETTKDNQRLELTGEQLRLRLTALEGGNLSNTGSSSIRKAGHLVPVPAAPVPVRNVAPPRQRFYPPPAAAPRQGTPRGGMPAPTTRPAGS